MTVAPDVGDGVELADEELETIVNLGEMEYMAPCVTLRKSRK